MNHLRSRIWRSLCALILAVDISSSAAFASQYNEKYAPSNYPSEIGILSGRVYNAATGTAVEGAAVRALKSDGKDWITEATVVSASDGSYMISSISAGTYRICAEGIRIGLVRQCFNGLDIPVLSNIDAATPVVLADGEFRGNVNFPMNRGGTITGKLIDDDTAAPVADVDVEMSLYDIHGALVDKGTIHTDPTGSYYLQGVPDGHFYLTAHITQGFKGTQLFPDIDCPSTCSPATRGQQLAISNSELLDGIDFRLKPDVTISGTVIDDLGHPLSDVLVTACQDVWGIPPYCSYTTHSQADGRYVLHINGRRSYTFFVRASERYSDQMYPYVACDAWCGFSYSHDGSSVTVDAGDRIDGIDFSLAPSTRISGTLRDAIGGQPLRGTIRAYDANGNEIWSVGTDDAGAYVGQKWPPGTYYLQAKLDDQPSACAFYQDRPCPHWDMPILSTDPTPIVVAAGDRRTGVDIRILSERIFLDGFEIPSVH